MCVGAAPGPEPPIPNGAGVDRPGWEIYGVDTENMHTVMGLDFTGEPHPAPAGPWLPRPSIVPAAVLDVRRLCGA